MSVRLHVEVAGAGPDLALIHGWGLNARVWGGAARRLAASFTLHAVELPGHGESPRVPGALGAWIDALAEALPPAHVLGWSLGAQLALALAARRPHAVRSLVLVAATPRFVAGGDWPWGVDPDALARIEADVAAEPRAALKRFLALQAQGDAAAREVTRVLRGCLAQRPLASAQALVEALALLRANDLRADARAVSAPTLVLQGARDPLVPAAAGRWLAQALARGRLEAFGSAAHAPFVSAEAEFADTVSTFVNGVEHRHDDKRRRHAAR
jgi:pimeloyl-[acyl-carrier protein] methyl ester esterase